MDIRGMKGDITEADQGMILHGCNNQGAMGSGVALAISNKWPNVKQAYLKMFEVADAEDCPIELGYVQFVQISPRLTVANGITQDGFRVPNGAALEYATVEAIEDCIEKSVLLLLDRGPEYRRLHIPQIGGTRGGLNFDKDVMPVIERMAAKYPSVTFVVWEYDNRNPEYI